MTFFFPSSTKSSAVTCLKQAALAHGMAFLCGSFVMLLCLQCFHRLCQSYFRGRRALCWEGGEWGNVQLQQNSFIRQLPSLGVLKQNCVQISCYNLLLLVWEDKPETSQSIC